MPESTSTSATPAGSDCDGRSDDNDQPSPRTDDGRRHQHQHRHQHQKQRQRTFHRMMQACEHCRLRKIKCDLRSPSCANCENRSVACHFSAQKRKRGPRPRPRPATATATATQRRELEHDQVTSDPGPTLTNNSNNNNNNNNYNGNHNYNYNGNEKNNNKHNHNHNLTDYNDAFSIDNSSCRSSDPAPSHSPTDFLYQFPTAQYTPHKHAAASLYFSPLSPFTCIYSELDAEIERLALGPSMPCLARKAVDLFFECLYPLMPIVHRPRIELGLCLLQPGIERRDADMQVFSLTTALCGIASAIIPSAIFREGSAIADKFYHASKRSLDLCCEQGLDKPTSASIAIRYFQSGYTHSVGVPRTSWEELEAAIALAQAMRLHVESSYVNLDYIEEQLCRRLFWVLFTGDKSAGILGKHHITLGRYLLASGITARYSRELEGEDQMMISASAEPSESELPALITGFNFNQDLWRTAYLVLLEIDRLNERYGQTIPPNEPSNRCPTPVELHQFAELYVSFETSLDTIPTCLRVHPDLSFVSSQFRFGQKPNQRPLPRAIALQRINLHVSYQCLRLVIAQAMANLLSAGVPLWHVSSPLWPIFTPTDLHLKPGQLSPISAHNTSEIHEGGSKSPLLLLLKIRIAEDMLYLLHTSTLEDLRLNGESCVEKIRLVGASMLELLHHHPDSPFANVASQFGDLFPHILAHMESKASGSVS